VATPTSDCDCSHPKADHPGGACSVCDCTYYDGCVIVPMVPAPDDGDAESW
jgi:hypothetical protein